MPITGGQTPPSFRRCTSPPNRKQKDWPCRPPAATTIPLAVRSRLTRPLFGLCRPWSTAPRATFCNAQPTTLPSGNDGLEVHSWLRNKAAQAVTSPLVTASTTIKRQTAWAIDPPLPGRGPNRATQVMQGIQIIAASQHNLYLLDVTA
ncbi:hypothetical protein ml_123 [Mollivirus sibericum]|uniref:hypothetical protein n=1 Tax=Mollivirus sibericum TaxID=1678078 RepID=UPI0006B2E6FD|nr:hypothetical protein ml_123 [Mollivirus sibericum]ALD61925.1 hypothetical protein ml_123 [Mollivirus sibericum]